MNKTQKLYVATALLWSIAGLVSAMFGDASIAAMQICIGMMFVVISCSKEICGVKSGSKPDAQPKGEK